MWDFVKNGKASVIVGGQFGSEAKGLAAAIMARNIAPELKEYMICTTNAGAQAGHTTILEDGTKFVCYHLPTIGVMIRESLIYLNAGSIIDPVLLAKEIINVGEATKEGPENLRRRIMVHPAAAIIGSHHREYEQTATTHLGSTMKGVGAALCDKVMRKPDAVARKGMPVGLVQGLAAMDLNSLMLGSDAVVTVEIPQGTGLSINASGFYPTCTSRDCWVVQGLSDAGIHPSFLHKTLMVQRTFPIRVGHIYGPSTPGLQYLAKIGDSGPFYADSKELEWEKDFPGIQPERTTVTNRVRRIATWSRLQYERAMSLNRPDIVMTTFTNYLADREELNLMAIKMRHVEMGNHLQPDHIWSHGPGVLDYVINIRHAKTRSEM